MYAVKLPALFALRSSWKGFCGEHEAQVKAH